MTAPAFIAVDWGTSNARFTLCDEAGRAIELRKGPGAVAARGKFEETFDSHTGDWRRAHGKLSAYLCGMAGSAIGWVEAPYLPCPAELDELVDAPVKIRDGVHVMPGMRCTNPLGAPDVMRGEETQLLGLLFGAHSTVGGHRLVCMPGTHTKWAAIAGENLQEFLTVPTGEIFAALCEHTVLVRDPSTPMEHVPAEFERGLAEARRHPGRLLHQVFQALSLRLDGQLTKEGAPSWISGLLIGAEVEGTLELFREHDDAGEVLIVGEPRLTALYARALAHHGRKAVEFDGGTAALAGLAFVFRQRERQGS